MLYYLLIDLYKKYLYHISIQNNTTVTSRVDGRFSDKEKYYATTMIKEIQFRRCIHF